MRALHPDWAQPEWIDFGAREQFSVLLDQGKEWIRGNPRLAPLAGLDQRDHLLGIEESLAVGYDDASRTAASAASLRSKSRPSATRPAT